MKARHNPTAANIISQILRFKIGRMEKLLLWSLETAEPALQKAIRREMLRLVYTKRGPRDMTGISR
jgi:hypothetical protein